MKVLNMIASWSSKNSPLNCRTWKDIPNEEKDWNSWWYLDGELEDFVGYDKATVSNCKSGGFAKETINWKEIIGDKVVLVHEDKPTTEMYINGEVDVEIEGIDRPCKGFFWTTDECTVYYQDKPYKHWKQRGLVCFADDKPSCIKARAKMLLRKHIL